MNSSDRILGTETEWGFWATWNTGQPVTDGKPFMSYVHANLPEGVNVLNGYLSNGGRFYLDVGAHPEYATPETPSLEQLIACEYAGEDLVVSTFGALVLNGTFRSATLNKRCVDQWGTTWGMHENYSTDPNLVNITKASEEHKPNFDLLMTHLASRVIFSGAGAMLSRGHGRQYFRAGQKFESLACDKSPETTDNHKPLLNLRNEPLANSNSFCRLHVVSGDTQLGPRARLLTLGSTSLVISLMESGKLPKGLAFPDGTYYLAAQQIARDPCGLKPLRLANGKTARAVDIQWEILQAVKELQLEQGLSEQYSRVVTLWEQTLSAYDNSPDEFALIADWMRKNRILVQYARKQAARRGCSFAEAWSDPKTMILDRTMDQFTPQGPRLFNPRQNPAEQPYLPAPELVTARLTEPPTSRAVDRGKFVSLVAGELDAGVSWDHLLYKGQALALPNPHDHNPKLIEQFVERAKKLA